MAWKPRLALSDGFLLAFIIIIIRLGATHERDRHADGHKQTPHDGIGRAYQGLF